MADNKKLSSFKVGDKHRPRVSSGSGTKKNQAETAVSDTMGFARIEALLDHEPPAEVGKRLAQMLDALDAQAATATAPKQRASLKKARLAVEKTIDLLDYLFRTKESLQQAAVAQK